MKWNDVCKQLSTIFSMEKTLSKISAIIVSVVTGSTVIKWNAFQMCVERCEYSLQNTKHKDEVKNKDA